MKTERKQIINNCKRVVIKVGTRLLTDTHRIPVLIAGQQGWEHAMELLSRNIEDLDEMNDSCFAGFAGCLDPGLEGGGLGHVNFKIYTEKV